MNANRRSPDQGILKPVIQQGDNGGMGAFDDDADELPKFLRAPAAPKRRARRRWRLPFWGRGDRPSPRRSWPARAMRFVLRWALILVVLASASLAALVAGYSYFADDPLKAGLSKAPAKLTILAENGKVIAEKGIRRNHVTVEEMPRYLTAAVTATEDRRFNSHWGVDPKGVIRAMWRNRQAGRLVQGGSTITQQVAKVLFLKPERTYRRKVEEVLLALSLEYRLQKKQILELYLNRIYFGAGNYGVEAAAQHYFGKGVGKLTLYECAILAGLIKSPNYYAPTTDMPRALERGKTVLNIMLEIGAITRAEYDAAIANPPTLRAYLPAESYGYVIDWVLQQIGDMALDSQEDQVVETTIDYEMQGVAQKIVKDDMDQNAAEFDAGEASAIIMDPNGAIKVLIGGRDYNKRPYNRAVQSKRQPGSTFKPFVWLAALEKGLTPDSKVHDGPIQIGNWSPSNYDNRYHGDVTLRDGLARSMNTVSVRLSEWVGRDTVVKTAHRLGIASPLQKIPSIALGTSEVSLLEIATAYLPFANGGYSSQPHIIKAVRDAHGEYTFKHGRTNWGRIIQPQHVGAMNSMMVATIETGTGHQASLEPHQAAGKTGTTQSYRDAWFVGFTTYYVTAVWIGNDDGKPMKRVTGGGLPTQIWRDLMLYAHVGKQPAPLPELAEYQQQAGSSGTGTGERTIIDELFGSTTPQPTLDQPAETGSTRPKKKNWLERLFE